MRAGSGNRETGNMRGRAGASLATPWFLALAAAQDAPVPGSPFPVPGSAGSRE